MQQRTHDPRYPSLYRIYREGRVAREGDCSICKRYARVHVLNRLPGSRDTIAPVCKRCYDRSRREAGKPEWKPAKSDPCSVCAKNLSDHWRCRRCSSLGHLSAPHEIYTDFCTACVHTAMQKLSRQIRAEKLARQLMEESCLVPPMLTRERAG